MDIGARVKDARKRAQLSQEALARRADMSLSAVRQIEQGGRTDPHYSTVSKIAAGLGMQVSELLEEPVPLDDAPSPGLAESTQQRPVAPLDDPAIKDTLEKRRAREAIGARMEEVGKPVRYPVMPQEELLARFDAVETPEEAWALQEAVRSECALVSKTLSGETFPGHPTRAVMGTLATAFTGVRRVLDREMARLEREDAQLGAALDTARLQS